MRKSRLGRSLLGCILLGICAILVLVGTSRWLEKKEFAAALPTNAGDRDLSPALAELNTQFSKSWQSNEHTPSPPADLETILRRLSLALTGAVPSLEEIRRIQKTAGSEEEKIQYWLSHLFSDRRYASYVAERLARVYVGVEPGPFLVYRRRRMVNWIADQLNANRPYDQIVRDLIHSEGIWTSHPEANFITVSIDQNNDKNGPDEEKLAARTSRAFLGVSLDCMQCHDDMFGDHWKQEHFHGLAAFYAQSEMSLTGVRDDKKKDYATRFRGEKEERDISPSVPFEQDLLPTNGSLRERLATWVTHPENRAFSRAMVNRAWGLLFGRPLVSPVNDIPLQGPYPAGMDTLTDAFIASGYDLQDLFRIIAVSEPFRRSSAVSEDAGQMSEALEKSWAAFPLTPLRPEQVIGSIIQASAISTIDSETHILRQLQRAGESNNFVKQFGDLGEEEFLENSGTIPQRLLLMNGKTLHERIKPNPLVNSSSRLAVFAKDPALAVRSAFLTVLTRLPTAAEKNYFEKQISNSPKDKVQEALSDLLWALMNSTEFSWNR